MLLARTPRLLPVACRSVMSSFTSHGLPSTAIGCVVYVSEGRNAAVVQQLEQVAREACAGGGAALASVFVDAPYNRSNFSLVGRSAEHLSRAATLLSRAALELLDFRQHAAAHPRLGVVDHISCHPLAGHSQQGKDLEHAADVARAIGEQLGGGPAPVPVYLYGAAHPHQQTLADIRRALGYFHGAAQGEWAGAMAAVLPLKPSLGPVQAPAWSGVCCVGASPFIVNFNLLLQDVTDFEAARRIARGVSEKGGGLRSVQAMALQHAEGFEVACNILDHQATPPELVEARVQELAMAEGGGVKSSYRIGKSPEQLLALAQRL